MQAARALSKLAHSSTWVANQPVQEAFQDLDGIAPLLTLLNARNIEATVQAAAQLSHMGDLRAMQRGLEAQAREAQGAAAPTAEEAALEEALDALDAVVRTGGDFEDARPAVADALERAGLGEEARLARGDD